MSIKLYTKTGDKGNTSLLGGRRVKKTDPRIEAYGNVDELNSFIGHLKDHDGVENRLKQQLYWIQEHLFAIGSILAAGEDASEFGLPAISGIEVTQLEVWIDKFDAELPSLKSFILPGGHPAVSLSHICRAVCRRTERSITYLANESKVDEEVLQFINRLSDYFFIFARTLSKLLDIPEVPWSLDRE